MRFDNGAPEGASPAVSSPSPMPKAPKKAAAKKAPAKKAAPAKAKKAAKRGGTTGPSKALMKDLAGRAQKTLKRGLKPLKEGRVTLRAELVAILKAAKKPMSTGELAARVAERKRFKKRNGSSDVTTLQVWTTAENAPDLKRDGTTVSIK